MRMRIVRYEHQVAIKSERLLDGYESLAIRISAHKFNLQSMNLKSSINIVKLKSVVGETNLCHHTTVLCYVTQSVLHIISLSKWLRNFDVCLDPQCDSLLHIKI